MSTLSLSVKPQRPWQPTFKSLIPDIFGALFTAFATLAIVGVTPLKGKLGFVIVLILMAITTTSIISWIRKDRKAALNSTSTVLVYVAAAFVIVPLASILWEIFTKGATGVSLNIFSNDMSATASDAPLSEGGLLHAIIGTVYLVFFASVVSTPIGILTALYIVEVKGKFAGIVRFFVQAMSGVPSIVAGLFIYAVWMIGLGNGYNAVAGAAALAILMIPTVARTSEEVLKLIPNDNIFSVAQRITMAQTQLQLAQSAPQMHNMYESYRRMYEAIGVRDIDSILNSQNVDKPKDPASENSMALDGSPLKAFAGQQHDAHIMTHLMFGMSPLVQGNPGTAIILQKHVLDHISTKAEEEVEAELFKQYGTDPDKMISPLQREAMVALKVVEGYQAMKAMQDKLQPPPSDPLVDLKKQELHQSAARDQANQQVDQAKLQLDQQKEQSNEQMDQANLALKQQQLGAKNGNQTR
jgi:hypothetical protein